MSSKRDRVLKKSKKGGALKLTLLIVVPLVGLLGALIFWGLPAAGGGNETEVRGRYEVVKLDDGVLTLPAANFDDYKARYYSYDTAQGPINFFVVKSSDGVIRAAFDACDVCFKARRGYNQAGEVMICNNCGQQFHSTRINVEKGGCNPAPLLRSVEGDSLIIDESSLLAGKRYFVF